MPPGRNPPPQGSWQARSGRRNEYLWPTASLPVPPPYPPSPRPPAPRLPRTCWSCMQRRCRRSRIPAPHCCCRRASRRRSTQPPRLPQVLPPRPRLQLRARRLVRPAGRWQAWRPAWLLTSCPSHSLPGAAGRRLLAPQRPRMTTWSSFGSGGWGQAARAGQPTACLQTVDCLPAIGMVGVHPHTSAVCGAPSCVFHGTCF